MFALFSGRHVGGAKSSWKLNTGLCKFVQNLLTNIWSLGKHREPKLGDVSFLPVSYNITISWLYPLNSFRFIFFFGCMTVKNIEIEIGYHLGGTVGWYVSCYLTDTWLTQILADIHPSLIDMILNQYSTDCQLIISSASVNTPLILSQHLDQALVNMSVDNVHQHYL